MQMCNWRVCDIAAQTEGDTGYDYNDAYEDSYDESSGQLVVVHVHYRLTVKAAVHINDCPIN